VGKTGRGGRGGGGGVRRDDAGCKSFFFILHVVMTLAHWMPSCSSPRTLRGRSSGMNASTGIGPEINYQYLKPAHFKRILSAGLELSRSDGD